MHFASHFADGTPTLSLSCRAFSARPSLTVFSDAGANSWMNAQSSANACTRPRRTTPHAPTPARTSRGFSVAQRLSFAITE